MSKGARIKELREAKGLTQEELAKLLNTKRQTVSKYEQGIITNIPSDRIESIARILDATPEYILGWEQNETEEENKKSSDTMSGITARMFNDKEFFRVVSFLEGLDEKQFNRVKVALSNLFEEAFDVHED